MLALTLALMLADAPNVRVTYEEKCLYCHSEEVTERKQLTEANWVKLIEQMRKKAPLFITRSDVPVLARFMARTLKLVPPVVATAPSPGPTTPVKVPVKTPVKPVKTTPLLPPLDEPPMVVAEFPDAGAADAGVSEELTLAEREFDREGAQLMQRRCSKCHSMARVYGKLDTFGRSMAVVERMRLKTGSGITDHDLEVLEGWLRMQFAETP